MAGGGEGGAIILYSLIMEELSEKVTFEQRLEDEGEIPVDFWEESVLN